MTGFINEINKDDYFREIYRLYRDKIYNFIYFKVYDMGLAEDLTNDVFVAVYKNLEKYDENKSFIVTWLYTISCNRLKNYYKSKRSAEYSIEYLMEKELEPWAVNCDLFEQKELGILLADAMRKLPERSRRVLIMKYYGDMTSVEIGRNLDISPGNVRIILKRSLNSLKESLSLN